MPPRWPFVITAFALASGCAPSQFAWHDDQETVDGYRRAFAKAAGDRFVDTASKKQFVGLAAAGRVLWLGDHHKSPRLHLLQRELLSDLQRAGRPLVLALEAIGEQDEPWIQQYLAGQIDEWLLRERMRRRWPGSWLDDPELDAIHYRTLLAFAARHRMPVAALEPTPRLPLAERDALIVARVRALAAAHPDRLVVVLLGQAHLLGAGNVAARCGLPSLIVGGEVTPPLLSAARPETAEGELLRSNGGVWWFGALLAEHGATAAMDNSQRAGCVAALVTAPRVATAPAGP